MWVRIRLGADLGTVRGGGYRGRGGSGPGDDPSRRPAPRPLRGDRVRLVQGSATDLRTALDADDDSYGGGVFDFGIVHHIQDWRKKAIAEVARVIAPGGRFFYFEEVTSHALARPPIYRRLFDHPTDDRFSAEQFLDELAHHGLVVLGSLTRTQGDYLLGAATKPVPTGGER